MWAISVLKPKCQMMANTRNDREPFSVMLYNPKLRGKIKDLHEVRSSIVKSIKSMLDLRKALTRPVSMFFILLAARCLWRTCNENRNANTLPLKVSTSAIDKQVM